MTAATEQLKDLGTPYEVPSTPLFKFDNEGVGCEGFLTNIEEGEGIKQFVFERTDGGYFKVNITADLQDKIGRNPQFNHYHVITYKGLDQSVVKNNNAMRLFKVVVYPNPRKG